MENAQAAPTTSTGRKQAATTFVILIALTGLEIAVSQLGGHHRAVVAALVGLAAVQGAVQLLYFMHLRWETKALRLYVMLPLSFPVLYALVLIADGIWRRLR
jgi:caa(3)-type oxidase subunit IV